MNHKTHPQEYRAFNKQWVQECKSCGTMNSVRRAVFPEGDLVSNVQNISCILKNRAREPDWRMSSSNRSPRKGNEETELRVCMRDDVV